MCRIKNLAILLGLCMVITACGSSEQQKSKVMLYQGDKNKKEEEHYKTTKVKKGTYEEKISATASLVYQNDKAVMIKDSNAYLDKILVKNGQKVVKGQKLATYHVKISDTKLKKKKLETEQARSEYDVNLKSKRNEVLQQERTIKTLTDATEKKLAVLQLNKLKSEYKDLQKQGKSIQKKEKDYNDLVQKRKSATLTSPYSGTVAEITDSIGDEASGENIMLIRDKKDFLLSAEDASGLRYNMTVDVGLGATLDSIKYHLKGKVISTDNLQQDGIDYYYIPTNDFHGSEYVADYFKCREYMSGFTGSAGSLLVSATEAGLWTDGRYFLQAEAQLAGSGITLYRMGEPGVPKIFEYIAQHIQPGQCLGFDGRMVDAFYALQLKKIVESKGARLVTEFDLVGAVWYNRPWLEAKPAYSLSTQYTGVERGEKLDAICKWLDTRKADMLVITSLDDIAWALNIRGEDIHCCPVVLSYLVIKPLERILFANKSAFSTRLRQELARDSVLLREYDEIYDYLAAVPAGSRVVMDMHVANYQLVNSVPQNSKIVNAVCPTKMMKAVKNPAEIAGEKIAHIKDGVALVRFMYWLKQNIQKIPLTERLAAAQLEAFRGSVGDYMGPSFDPIAAYGPHGAIVHYSATEETDARILTEGFLLLDTGGHYLQGTTDVTRTILLGQEATPEEKKYYTAVLCGNLRLAAAKFKKGCSGVALDILARQPLWDMGCDFNHGTGHGVGCLLNVHEGPNAIRYRIVAQPDGNVELQPGMITSDEPGVYLEGKFGIRLENLLLCVEKEQNEFGQFLGFEALTLAPFERDAIDPSQMTQQDKLLLNEYHEKVYDTISPYLDRNEAEWLMDACAPID